MDIANAWGYGAVIVPAVRFYQGFIIHDPRGFRDDIAAYSWAVRDVLASSGMTLTEDAYIGSLQASLVECVLVQQQDNEARAAIICSALAEHIGRFWIVTGERDSKGTTTRYETLAVATPEEARAAIEQRCQPIREALAKQYMSAVRH
jgi:hypothetical protein